MKRRVLVSVLLIVAYGVAWWMMLDHIAGRVLANANAAQTSTASTPLLAKPVSFYRNGWWRVEAYGLENCVWVQGRTQNGHWIEGYWRRKPRHA